MSDNFSYGGRGKPSGPSFRIDPVKLGVGVLALALLVAGSIAIASVLRGGGEDAGEAAEDAVSQVDLARDAEAQVVLNQAATTAQTLIAAGGGSPEAAGVEELAQAEPSFTYTDDASSDPEVVSVATSANGWSAAALSPSGVCLWIRIDVNGTQTFGSGTPCTGEAAAAASDPAW